MSSRTVTYDKNLPTGEWVTFTETLTDTISTTPSTTYHDTTTGTHINNDGFFIGLDSNDNGHIEVRENKNLIFETNNTEKMRITSDGKIGIGITQPLYNLSLETNNSATMSIKSNNLETNGSLTQLDLIQKKSDENIFNTLNIKLNKEDSFHKAQLISTGNLVLDGGTTLGETFALNYTNPVTISPNTILKNKVYIPDTLYAQNLQSNTGFFKDKVGIGITNPSVKLQIYDSNNVITRVKTINGNQALLQCRSEKNDLFGWIGIDTSFDFNKKKSSLETLDQLFLNTYHTSGQISDPYTYPLNWTNPSTITPEIICDKNFYVKETTFTPTLQANKAYVKTEVGIGITNPSVPLQVNSIFTNLALFKNTHASGNQAKVRMEIENGNEYGQFDLRAHQFYIESSNSIVLDGNATSSYTPAWLGSTIQPHTYSKGNMLVEGTLYANEIETSSNTIKLGGKVLHHWVDDGIDEVHTHHNVGIGITSPATNINLHIKQPVNTAITLEADNALGNSWLDLKTIGNNWRLLNFWGSLMVSHVENSLFSQVWNTTGESYFNYNVGIGTNNPICRLDVRSTTNSDVKCRLQCLKTADDATATLEFKTDSTNNPNDYSIFLKNNILVVKCETTGKPILQMFGAGDLKVYQAGKGIMLTSPDGNTVKKLTINNSGDLTLL